MKITLSYIANRGDIQRERLIYVVEEDGDIGVYLVLYARFAGETATTDVRQIYWFPDLAVKRGDRVVLYTKAGTPKSNDRKEGGKTHFYYWGLTNPLWDGREFGVSLIEANTWASVRADLISETPKLKILPS